MQRSDFFKSVVLPTCMKINTPRSLTVALLYKYGEDQQIAELSIKPSDYLSQSKFDKDLFVTSLLSKYKGLEVQIDPTQAALRSWQDQEATNRLTNSRIRDGRLRGFPPRVESAYFYARRKIAAILGPLDSKKIGRLLDLGSWGSGATATHRRGANYYQKATQSPSVTLSCLKYARHILSWDPHWFEALTGLLPEGPYSALPSNFSLVEGEVMDRVPKKATTDRIIAKNPNMNGFVQKGVGEYIRHRLVKFGVDLNCDLGNQDAARSAYSGMLSTLDLKSASDSLCTELVYELLPVDWALLLDNIRCPLIKTLDGDLVSQQKFSAMGNGFTFELESMIFYALLHSLTNFIKVYGDDIVIERKSTTAAIEILEFSGFATNPSKSFIDGDFYESCGSYFFQACDVKPVYQKAILDSLPEKVRCYNRISRWFAKRGYCSPLSVRQFCRDQRPPLQPYWLEGDFGFVGRHSPISYCRNRGFCYYLLIPIVRMKRSAGSSYFYKIRRPSYSLSASRGNEELQAGQVYYKARRTWINFYGVSVI